MRLVEIDGEYINPEFIQRLSSDYQNHDETWITIDNDSFIVNMPIKKVLDAIGGSEEHVVNEAVIELLYNANYKLIETNEKLINKIKDLNR